MSLKPVAHRKQLPRSPARLPSERIIDGPGEGGRLSRIRRRTWLTAVALLAMVGWRPYPAAADTIVELGGSRVRVEVATATPAPKEGRSRLQFRIVNEGRDPLHLIGIRSDVTERADLLARTGASTETLLTSFPIPPGAELDLTTSHLRFELYPLRRDLVTDETFTAILDFVRWKDEIPVHVHGATTSP